jgi:hypothetical protein
MIRSATRAFDDKVGNSKPTDKKVCSTTRRYSNDVVGNAHPTKI